MYSFKSYSLLFRFSIIMHIFVVSHVCHVLLAACSWRSLRSMRCYQRTSGTASWRGWVWLTDGFQRAGVKGATVSWVRCQLVVEETMSDSLDWSQWAIRPVTHRIRGATTGSHRTPKWPLNRCLCVFKFDWALANTGHWLARVLHCCCTVSVNGVASLPQEAAVVGSR